MNQKIAKYQIIAHDLLNKIQSNVYAVGTIIPREIDLAQKYQVSRPTIRQAIQSLVELGLLEKRKHRGTIVKAQHIQQQFMQIIENYNTEIDQKGLIPKTKVLLFTTIHADQNLAQNLNLKPQAPVFKLIRLRYANANPLVIVTTYLPQEIVPQLINHDFNQESLYESLALNHQEIGHVRRQLAVKLADSMTANLLNITTKDPLFHFQTWGFNQKQQIIEYSLADYRGDLNSFVIDLDEKHQILRK